MRRIYITLCFCFLSTAAFAQQDSSSEELDRVTEDKIEDIAASTDADLDYNTLLDQLNYYSEHPLNLNTATKDELEALLLLNPLQIDALLKHIKENGKLIALEELQTIDGFDRETIYRILPYIKLNGNAVADKITLKRLIEEGKSSMVTRFQQVLQVPKGYSPKNFETGDTSRYLGSRAKIYSQYRYRLGNQISMGITAEKDAGEQFFKGTQSDGFDFYSAHLFYRGNNWLKSFVVGDYQAQYGQGLTFGNGLTFGKSIDVLNIKKNASGISPYISTNENAYLRGAAVSLGGKKVIFDLFYSNHKVDANVSSKDSLTSEEIVSPLELDGYHRTYSELADKHTLDELLYGGHLQYKLQNLNIGVTGYAMMFDKDLIKTFHPYNEFEFSGDHNSNFGADYTYAFSNVNLFGEVARSENGGMAYLNGALVNLDPRVGISLLYRHYDTNYQILFSNGFAETSGTANEEGLFMGIVTKPVEGFTLSGYYDQFNFPWLRYLVNAPTFGNEYIAQLTYTPSKTFEAYFRIKQKEDPADITADTHPISNTVDVSQTNYRFNIKYKVSADFTFGNRIEYITYKEGAGTPQTGFMIYQDVTYKPVGSKLALTFRYSIFDSDSYNSRIYSYQSEVPGAYSIPFSDNSGSTFYAMLHYRLLRNIECWLRYSITIYDNINTISTGLNEINGNQISQVEAQMKFQF